jgi:pyruvate dehydrogenase complex dehydrogenase (E1) component
VHPPMPEGAEDGIVSGMYLFKDADPKLKGPKV